MDLYKILLIFQLSVSVLVFLFLSYVSAPYGRFSRGGWGPLINSLTAWILMELPAVLTIAVMAWIFRTEIKYSWVFLLIWEFHYIYRTFFFPAMMKHGRKTFPVSMVVTALFFNVMNGFINGYYLFHIRPVGPEWFTSPGFIIGTAIFFTGFAIHFDSDRRIQSQKPGPGHYIIPRGGMFTYVSGPNYFGEIVMWSGWALLTWSLAGAAFALFTFANVFPRGVAGHKWYLENFEDYPKERKAVIPRIY